MFPTPEIRVWSRRRRLTPDVRRRTRSTKRSSSNSGSMGSRAMWAISAGSSAPPGERESPPNIRWSTNRSSSASALPACSPSGPPERAKRTRRWRSMGAETGCTSICPLIPRWARSASPLSSGSQRYFPRRRAASTVRPVRDAAKSSGPARWRRTGRGWKTSTATKVRPTTCASRPARTTSTSGSSGKASAVGVGGGLGRRRLGTDTAGCGLLHDCAYCGTALRGDRPVGGLGGLLLGLLLRPAGAETVERVTDLHLRGEGLLVVGPLVLDDVLGDAERVLRRELLEAGLPVQAGTEPRRGLHQGVEEQVDHVIGRGEPTAEVDRADDRL